jgi:hypothetical protein
VKIINEGKPHFEGDGVDLLIATYRDPEIPLEIRLTCAREAARYERSQRSPSDAPPGGSSLEALVMASHEQRMERASELIAKTHRLVDDVADGRLTIEATPVAPEPAPNVMAAELKASIVRVEGENQSIRDEIERMDRQRQDRQRLAGVDFLPFGRVR